jgi:hypothetical protein
VLSSGCVHWRTDDAPGCHETWLQTAFRLSDCTLRAVECRTSSETANSSRCGADAALLLCCCCRYSGASKNRPTIFELSGGSIEKDKVKNEWDNYESSYGKEAGEGIKDR